MNIQCLAWEEKHHQPFTCPTLYFPDQKRLTQLERFCFWCENFESDVLFILKLAQVLPKVSEFSPKILPRHGVSTCLCFEPSERGTLQHGGAGLTLPPQKNGGVEKNQMGLSYINEPKIGVSQRMMVSLFCETFCVKPCCNEVLNHSPHQLLHHCQVMLLERCVFI